MTARARARVAALALALGVAAQVHAAGPELALQTGHIGPVSRVAWSPDNRKLATAANDGTARVWDADTGRLLASRTFDEPESIAWSPDGHRIAIGAESSVAIWNTRVNTIDAELPGSRRLRWVSWSPDGARLAGGDGDQARVWSVSAAGFEAGVDAAGLRAVDWAATIASRVVAWSPDARFVARAAGDVLEVRHQRTGKIVARHVHRANVHSMAWSPDGKFLAFGSLTTVVLGVRRDGEGILLEEVVERKGHTSWIESLAFSPDGGRLATASADASAIVWSVPEFRLVGHAEGHASSLQHLAWSPDGTRLATASHDATARVWLPDGSPVAVLTPRMRRQLTVDWSADGRYIAAAGRNSPPRIWDVRSGQVIAALEAEKGRNESAEIIWEFAKGSEGIARPMAEAHVTSVRWSADGRLAAAWGSLESGFVAVWQPLTWSRSMRAELTGNPYEVAWHPAGGELAIGMRTARGAATLLLDGAGRRVAEADHVAEIPRFLDGKAILPPPDPVSIHSLAWSPDGLTLARNDARLWSRERQETHGPVMKGECVAWSPDGRYLLSGPTLLRAPELTVAAELPVGSPHHAAWSRDSRFVAIASGGSVSVWDAQAASRVAELPGGQEIAWSPDGAHLLIARADGTLGLFSLRDGIEVATLISFGEGTDWLVTTPEGLFDGSPASWSMVGWHDDPADYLHVTPVEVYFRDYYSPGLLTEILSGARPRPAQLLASRDRRQPSVRLALLASSDEGGRTRAQVRIDVSEAAADAAHRAGSGARDVRLFRNGTLVKVWRGDISGGRSSLTASVRLVAGDNQLVAYAFSGSDVKSADSVLHVDGGGEARRSVLHVIGIGINRYANPEFDLRYAVADANAFVAELRVQQQRLGRYARVEAVEVADAGASKRSIIETLTAVARTIEPEDTLVIYYAGHGLAERARYYLVPHDLQYEGTPDAIDRQALSQITGSSVSDLDLEQALEAIDAERIVLVIDACNSGRVLEAEERRRGPMNSRGLAQLAWEKGISVLAAAQGYQAALEASQLGHGYLTFALVEEGLKGAAADVEPRDGAVLLREWLDYAVARVPLLQQSAMEEGRKSGREIAFVDGEQALRALAERSLQRPRVFYRREPESRPFVVARTR